MARPLKDGMDYFPHDVDMSNDQKIEALEERHGLVGYAIYCKLLERIYRSGGKFFICSEQTFKIVAGKFCSCEIDTLKGVINVCLDIGLFDTKRWEDNGQLISNRVVDVMQIVLKERVRMRRSRKNKSELYTEQTPEQTTEQTPGQTPEQTGESKVKESKLNTYIPPQDVAVVLRYFSLAVKKEIRMTRERGAIVAQRLKEGRTVEEMQVAIDNFSADTWDDRQKFLDVVYCLGTRNKINNLDKWLTVTKKDDNRIYTP